MLSFALLILILVVIFSLIFDYVNGFNDTANAIATCVSTRALSIKVAIVMAAVLNFCGAIISTKVAATIGKGIVDANQITQLVILAGIIGAIGWGLFTWYFGLPSSSSHALVGGIVGAVIAHSGFAALHWKGLRIIVLALLLSPVVGVLVSLFFVAIITRSIYKLHPAVLNKNFRRLQIVSAALMAFAHGMGDAQKSMGIITMALVSFGVLHTFHVPWEVILACAVAMALGTAGGGLRIIKTVGKDFVKLQPIDGFCLQTTASAVILGAAFFGLPTSTTHVVASSVLGVGLSKRLSAVNWKIAFHILLAAVFTIPAVSAVAFMIYKLLANLIS